MRHQKDTRVAYIWILDYNRIANFLNVRITSSGIITLCDISLIIHQEQLIYIGIS